MVTGPRDPSQVNDPEQVNDPNEFGTKQAGWGAACKEKGGGEERHLGLSGLWSGFESPDLDRPGRLPHQQGPCEARLGYRDRPPQVLLLGAAGPV